MIELDKRDAEIRRKVRKYILQIHHTNIFFPEFLKSLIVDGPLQSLRLYTCITEMVVYKLKMCMELLELAIEFVIAFIEAVMTVIQHSSSPYTTVAVPLIGILL